jgi:hypothetical protein
LEARALYLKPFIFGGHNKIEFGIDREMTYFKGDLKELKISSYIHDLNLELDSIEPYFSKQIPGKYTGHFKIKINDQKSFKIDNYIKIEEYVNPCPCNAPEFFAKPTSS